MCKRFALAFVRHALVRQLGFEVIAHLMAIRTLKALSLLAAGITKA
jgi:hypothetical protein